MLVAAMGAPVMQIADNAGLLGALVREKVADHDWGYGFNAKTLQYEDLLKASPLAPRPRRRPLLGACSGACLQAGVCDPASVTTWALENAASITGSMLTTEVRRGEVGRCGQMWADMGRCGQMWGDAHHRDVGRWGDVGRCSPPRCGEGERGRCGEGERGRRERGERGGEMRASLPGSPPLLDVASALDVF